MLFDVGRHKKTYRKKQKQIQNFFLTNDCSRSGLFPDKNLTVNKAVTYDEMKRYAR